MMKRKPAQRDALSDCPRRRDIIQLLQAAASKRRGYLTLAVVGAGRREAQLGRSDGRSAQDLWLWLHRTLARAPTDAQWVRFRLRSWAVGGEPRGGVMFKLRGRGEKGSKIQLPPKRRAKPAQGAPGEGPGLPTPSAGEGSSIGPEPKSRRGISAGVHREPCSECEALRWTLKEVGVERASVVAHLEESQAQQARLTELLKAAQAEVGRLNEEKAAIAVELALAQVTAEVLNQGIDAINARF